MDQRKLLILCLVSVIGIGLVVTIHILYNFHKERVRQIEQSLIEAKRQEEKVEYAKQMEYAKQHDEQVKREREKLERKAGLQPYKNVKVGDIITFGHYEQDNDLSNGKEPISWRVLAKDDSGNYLIASEKVLDCQLFTITIDKHGNLIPYNDVDKHGNLIPYGAEYYWKNSTIRSWLNGYDASENMAKISYTEDNFIGTAFDSFERKQIRHTRQPDVLPYDEMLRLEDRVNGYKGRLKDIIDDFYTLFTIHDYTSDNIFLLSIVEVLKYMEPSKIALQVSWTPYAKSLCHDSKNNYFLRTKSSYTRTGAMVNDYGSFENDSWISGRRDSAAGVRPALWVSLQ